MSDKPIILIVEDNDANLRLASTALASHGFEVLLATSCEEAQNSIKLKKPHVILMDLQLPDMDGLQLTTQLKQDPATKNIIIIAVTAYAMDADRDKALNAGCDDYLIKPYDVFELPVMIKKHLQGFIKSDI